MSRDSFWSRRRAGVAAEAQAEEVALIQAEEAEAEAKLSERSDDEILAELDLPQPEELDSPEAVRGFMKSAVPQRLKARALRRLWRLNPVLANLDGLVDYGEDYTDAAMVVENLQTAYQVGKGMLSHIEALAAKEAAKAAAEAEAEAEDPDQVRDAEEIDPELIAMAETPSEPIPDLTPEPGEGDFTAPRTRRMTFTFEDQRT